MKEFRRLLPVFFGLLLFVTTTVKAAPNITSVTPLGLQPGATTEVSLSGTELTSPLKIWTSFPAEVELLPTSDGADDATTAKLRLKLTDHVGVGVGAISVAGATGVSQLYLVVIEDAPVIAEPSPNNTLSNAALMTLPAAVQASSSGTVADYFRFEAKAGQVISVDVLAARINSVMDPVVRLIAAANGAELAYADDSDGLGADARVQAKIPSDGQYVVEILDSKYAGNLPYYVRIGEFPLATTTLPASVQVGEDRDVSFSGAGASGLTAKIAMGTTLVGDDIRAGAKIPNGTISGFARARASSGVQVVETEPNDEITQATTATFPGGASGVFQQPGDKDYFKFNAMKGQRLRFSGHSLKLGSPAVVNFRVLKTDGTQLAAAPINPENELLVAWSVPEDGEYILEASELLQRGGDEYAYVVESAIGNSFTLTLKNDKATRNRFVVDEGKGGFQIPITVARDGYAGPITIKSKTEIPGITWHNNIIAKDGKEITVLLEFSAETKAGDFVNLEIVGEAEIDGQITQVSLTSRDWTRTQFGAVTYPYSFLQGVIQYATVPAIEEFFEPKFEPEAVYVARGETTATIQMSTASKHKDFKGALSRMFEDVPEGITVADKADKGVHTITVTVPADLTDEKTFSVKAYAEHAGHLQFVKRSVPIKVVDPLSVSIRLETAIAPGASQKALVTIVRAPGSAAEVVTLKLAGLPDKVTVPAELTIAADQTELEVEFTAAADAVVAKTDGITISAKSKYAGKDVSAVSAAIAVEVKVAE
ncbi:MAG: PPC domain-containing protein [Planctomycetota bacterium]|nr:PPC domain-containing protein [Planctomycetota bacterium]